MGEPILVHVTSEDISVDVWVHDFDHSPRHRRADVQPIAFHIPPMADWDSPK